MTISSKLSGKLPYLAKASKCWLIAAFVVATMAGASQLKAMKSVPTEEEETSLVEEVFLALVMDARDSMLSESTNAYPASPSEIIFHDAEPLHIEEEIFQVAEADAWEPIHSERPNDHPISVSTLNQSVCLGFACMFGDVDNARSIIEASDNPYALICSQDLLGRTALHNAASSGKVEVVRLLLEVARCEGKVQDLIAIQTFVIIDSLPTETAIDTARRHGHADVVELLES